MPPAPQRTRRSLTWVLLTAALLVFLVISAIVYFSTDRVRFDLSARDQELCGIVLDEDESIGYLSTQIDELIQNDGDFASEGAAYAFAEVPVGRSQNELNSRIANYDQPDSAGYIDDPELLDGAKTLRDVLFDLSLASDGGGPIDAGTLGSAREAIEALADTCTS
jgi:hypothetical protein